MAATPDRRPPAGAMTPDQRRQAAMDRLADRLSHLYMSPDDLGLDIALRVLESDTAQGILAPVGTTPAEEIMGQPFDLLGVVVTDSGFQGGIGFYALLSVRLAKTGEEVTVSCGAANVVAQAAALADRGFLPIRVQLVAAENPTARGFTPYSLREVEPEEAF